MENKETPFKCCINSYIRELHSYLLVDEYFADFGICAHCYWDKDLEGKDLRPRAFYFIKKEGDSYIGTVDLKNGSRFNIVVMPRRNGKVFVGIERLSCFHFANWESLMPPRNQARYIAEKLACAESDGFELSEVFTLLYNKITNEP